MRRPGARALLAAAVAAAVAAPGGWFVTDHLERDDDFCNACHLPDGVPLHRDVRRDFDARVATSLAGAHARSGDGATFRCIDCHGGAGFVGRLRVKALAARDAFWYVVGHFEEPDGMRWPLRDEDCTKCHDRFEEGPPEPWRSPRFHEVPPHNVELGVDCVACHLSHERGGDPDNWFLHASAVRSQCARCHPEFEEGRG